MKEHAWLSKDEPLTVNVESRSSKNVMQPSEASLKCNEVSESGRSDASMPPMTTPGPTALMVMPVSVEPSPLKSIPSTVTAPERLTSVFACSMCKESTLAPVRNAMVDAPTALTVLAVPATETAPDIALMVVTLAPYSIITSVPFAMRVEADAPA